MARERSEPLPALAASAFLHVAVLGAALFLSQWLAKPLRVGEVTTVTLMTSADVANLRAAEPSPTPTDASTPTPVPTAPPDTAPPAPPAATQSASRAPPAPAPSTSPDSFFKDVAHDLSGGGRPSAAPKGKAQPTTRPTSGAGAGEGPTASPADVASLTTALEKAWILNCDDVGDANINVDVSFTVGATGYIKDRPVATPPNTLAARRAIDAVYKLEPFKDFRGLYGRTVPKVHFNAKEACAKR